MIEVVYGVVLGAMWMAVSYEDIMDTIDTIVVWWADRG